MMTPSLENFCRRAGEIVARRDNTAAGIAAVLPDLLSDSDLALPVCGDSGDGGYRRYELFVCPHERFSVLALVWPPGIHSPIHSHFTWCALGLWRGLLRETRYAAANGGDLATETERQELRPGGAAHLGPGAENIHAIHNPGESDAVSLHIYGGNWRKTGPNLEKVFRAKA